MLVSIIAMAAMSCAVENTLPTMTIAPTIAITETFMPMATIRSMPTMCVTAEEGLWVRTLPDAEAPLARPKALLHSECVTVYEMRNGWARIGEGEWVNAGFLH